MGCQMVTNGKRSGPSLWEFVCFRQSQVYFVSALGKLGQSSPGLLITIGVLGNKEMLHSISLMACFLNNTYHLFL